MDVTQTEATCRLAVKEEDENGDRLLTSDELAEFVSDFADHLGDDARAIDPVVFGDAGLGTVEIVFGLSCSSAERDTHVAVFDIIHDAGEALGCAWRNDPERKRAFRRPTPPATRKLTRQSQQIAATELVYA